ncbi:MAG: metallophosphoesterase [Pseudomonadota bacterium]
MTRTLTIVIATFIATIIALETFLGAIYVSAKRSLVDAMSPKESASFQNCVLPRLSSIPTGATAIIGHAYGAPNRGNDFIAPKVERFLRHAAQQLDAVVFSGDVFERPSQRRWQQLASLSSDLATPFFVVPGNHDVGLGDTTQRDIWETTQYHLGKEGYTTMALSGFTVVLEDSIQTGWQISEELKAHLSALVSEKPILLVRHNIAVEDMLAVANSGAGLSTALPSADDFAKSVPSGVVVVSGDSGAFERLPRVSCHET